MMVAVQNIKERTMRKENLKPETCDHDHSQEHDVVTLTLDDGSDLECPIVDIFEITGQEYIALLHPKDEVVLLYRFFDHEDGTIEVTDIVSDEEFDKVSKFVNKRMMEE
jgi:uncharacterized protein YrzB (UPF0473 family)